MKPTCETCKFWRKEATDGTCMRYPPSVFLLGMMPHPITRQQQPGFTSAFPTIKPTLWCGEHQTKLEGLQ